MTQRPSSVAPRPLAGLIPSRETIRGTVRCPFKLVINPHRATAANMANAWLLQRFSRTASSKRLTSTGMDLMTAGFYPEAGPGELTWATKFLLWAFTLDDLADETDLGQTVHGLSQTLEGLERTIGGEPANGHNSLALSLQELLETLGEYANDAQLQTFRDGLSTYFGAMLWEANNRAHQRVPDRSSYQQLRPAAGAVPPFFALLEPLNGIRLTEEERSNPQLKHLTQLAGRIACWYNDLLSYEKERQSGDLHNLALVMERESNMSPAEAFERAVGFANEEVDEFVSLAQKLRGPSATTGLRRYVAALEATMAVTLEITYASGRYGSANAPPEVATFNSACS